MRPPDTVLLHLRLSHAQVHILLAPETFLSPLSAWGVGEVSRTDRGHCWSKFSRGAPAQEGRTGRAKISRGHPGLWLKVTQGRQDGKQCPSCHPRCLGLHALQMLMAATPSLVR